MVAHSAELSLARPHGPLDRAINLRLLDWDVDRSGRGNSQISDLLTNLLELWRCVAHERNPNLTVPELLNHTLNTIRDLIGDSLIRNRQAVNRLRICIAHNKIWILESCDSRTILPLILRAKEAMVQADGGHSPLAELSVFV